MVPETPQFSQFDEIAAGYDEITFTREPARQVVRRANFQPGEHVLDVACGTGWVTIPAAQAVGPTGQVQGIDIAPAMMAQAQRKAVQAGVDNIIFTTMDGQAPDFPEQSFAAITCSLALFAFADINQTLANWKRLLKPGGRVIFATWGEGFYEPHLTLLIERLKQLIPDYDPLSVIVPLDHVQKCRHHLAETGYAEISVKLVDTSYYQPTSLHYWREMTQLVQVQRLKELSNEQRQALQDNHLADLSDLVTENGIRINAPVVLSSAINLAD